MAPVDGLGALVRATLHWHAPAPFLSPASAARIAALADALPGPSSKFFGFECRLGGHAPQSDFLVCITSEEAAALADGVDRRPPGPEPFWDRLVRFCRCWSDPAHPWHALIDNIWLEFDLVGRPGHHVPPPAVFVGTSTLTHGAGPAAATAVSDALDALAGVEPSAIRRDALRRAQTALPPGGRLFQLGIMLSRGDQRLRICACGMQAVTIGRFLTSLGAPDSDRDAWIVEWERRCAEVRIGFDLGAGPVGTRLGVECYGGPNQAQWQTLIDKLSDDGLALPAEMTELLSWWGLLHQRLLRDCWPAWLGASLAGTSGGIARSLHHIKLTWDASLPVAAKAYLAARLVWFDDAELAASLRSALAPASA